MWGVPVEYCLVFVGVPKTINPALEATGLWHEYKGRMVKRLV